MKRLACLLVIVACSSWAAERRAKNVILFIGDAGGLPTLNAASLYGHDAPQKLFIQQMPHVGLSDTSAANGWVTDSAAGMTAIVTGHKTNNGVISQSAEAVRGSKDGETLMTILEHAEERGLSTGVLTNMNATDATPAACYAHANDRKMSGEIFAQVFKPRHGDGIDLIIGAGRDSIFAATEKLGFKVEPSLRERGYEVLDSPDAIPAKARRIIALMNSGEFELNAAMDKAIHILSQNPKGFFLMVEWDMHTTNIKRGLDRAVAMDNAVRRAAERTGKDTLIIYAADHSFDLRVRGGRKGQPMIPAETVAADPAAASKAAIRVENGHTGEEVVVAAQGPGAERVRGFFPNTELFRIMMAAYGWDTAPRKSR
jgi:alkaline phosphatase